MQSDLINHPQLAGRIFECLAARGRIAGLIDLFRKHVSSGECLYESTEVAFFETLLRHDISGNSAPKAKAFAKQWLEGKTSGTGLPHSKGPAAILLYWLGDGRAAPMIQRILMKPGQNLTGGVARSLLASLVALNPKSVNAAIQACVGFDSPATSSFAKLLQKLRTDRGLELPNNRLVYPRKPFTTNREIYEARAWLKLEVLSLSCSKKAKGRLRTELKWLHSKRLGACESKALRRLKRRLR